MKDGVLFLLLRGDLLSIMGSDFILAARARGLSEWFVVTRHALRPCFASFITASGLMMGQLIGGVILVEYWYTIPGVGLSVWDALGLAGGPLDYNVILGVVVVTSVVCVTVNLIIDVVYRVLDPRIRWS